MTAILRLQLDDKDPVRVNSAINQLAEFVDRGGGGGAGARTSLTANTTFYVSTTGSDTNSGASAGSPFLTIQHAYDYIVRSLDTAGFTVTIQLADGTYTSGLQAAASWSGGGQIVLQGNATTPDNVVINTAGNCVLISCMLPAQFIVQNMKITSSGQNGLALNAPGVLAFKNIDFGTCSRHMFSLSPGGSIRAIGDYTISGGAFAHASANNGGDIQTINLTVTFVGTPTFPGYYAIAVVCGTYECFNITFVGSFIGVRYSAEANGVIYTNGAGVNFFPGTIAGSPSTTGGQYL